MDRFIVDQLFQQRRRTVPVDPLQLQEADVEPGTQQTAQIAVQRREHLVCAAHRQQEAAQVHEELLAVGNRGELRQQPQPRRLQRLAQRCLGAGAFGDVLGRLYFGESVGHGIGIGIEARQRAQKRCPALLIRRKVGLGQLCRPVACADLAAPAGEACLHLRLQRLVGLPTDARRHVPPDGRDPPDRPVQQTARSCFAHRRAPFTEAWTIAETAPH